MKKPIISSGCITNDYGERVSSITIEINIPYLEDNKKNRNYTMSILRRAIKNIPIVAWRVLPKVDTECGQLRARCRLFMGYEKDFTNLKNR